MHNMQKKRFLLVLFVNILLLVLLSASVVFAQPMGDSCCVTPQSCEDVMRGTYEANTCQGELKEYVQCSVLPDCDYGCCCWLATSDRMTFRNYCEGSSDFTTGDFSKCSEYNSIGMEMCDNEQSTLCSDSGLCGDTGIPVCAEQYKGCAEAVPEDCICGNKQATAGQFCCFDDMKVYDTDDACFNALQSSCALEVITWFNVNGKVLLEKTDGTTVPAVGASVAVEDQTTTTDSNGDFAFTNVVKSTQTTQIDASFNASYLDSFVVVSINARDISNIELILKPKPVIDDDNDGLDSTVDPCDTEEKIPSLVALDSTETSCSDGIDNDCNGDVDCLDYQCTGDANCPESDIDCFDNVCDVIGGECGFCNAADPGNDCTATDCCGNNVLNSPYGEQCDGTAENECPSGCDYTTCQCSASAQCFGRTDWECNSNSDCDPGEECAFCVCYDDSSPAVCGDGKVEGYEHCDGDIDTIAEEARRDCAGMCGVVGKPSECQCLDEHTCGNGVIEPPFEECDDASGDLTQCPNGICTNCECQYECYDDGLEPPTAFTAEAVQDNLSIKLTWGLSSFCKVTTFKIYKDGNVINETDEFSFIDDDVFPEFEYCYEVAAVYDTGGAGSEENLTEEICIQMGDAECFHPENKGEFCVDNARFNCTYDNFVIGPLQDCDDPGDYYPEGKYVCTQYDEFDRTECVYQSDCTQCNGYFGLYAIIGEADQYIPPNIYPRDCFDIETCILDHTRTTIDKYYACENITSCYDYMSEGSCSEDKCRKSNCQWNEHPDYQELGIGVCSSTLPEEQLCIRCQYDADINEGYNKIFGACSQEMCKLYGECYFGTPAGDDSCLHRRDLGCSGYIDKKDCVMNSSIERPVLVDTEWTIDNCDLFDPYANCSKHDGTNVIIQPSDDYFGFGVCDWVDFPVERCVKNADNNNWYDDCGGPDLVGRSVKECGKDYETPETIIEVQNVSYFYDAVKGDLPLIGRESLLRVFVTDNFYNQYDGGTKTYACLGPACYPNTTSYNGSWINLEAEKGLFDFDYPLRFFSEDLSKNLELVKEITVVIETVPPDVKITNFTSHAASVDGETWYSNLTIYLNVTDNYDAYEIPNVRCTTYLESFDGDKVQEQNDIDDEFGSNWERTYYEIEDDIYYFYYSCIDTAGNTAEGKIEFDIEGDRSITDPRPRGTINYLTVPLSVKTTNNASETVECKYELDDNNWWDEEEKEPEYFDDLTKTFGVGGNSNLHTAVENLDNLSKYYIYNVKCLFSEQGVKGNRNDRIRFTVDVDPPKISVVDCITEEPFDINRTYGYDIEFCLKCVDDAGVEGRDFGCNFISYWFEGMYATEDFSDGKFLSNSITLSNTTRISYHVEDNGTNARAGYFDIYVDKSVPEFEAALFNSPSATAEPLDAFGFGYFYVKVNSSKNLMDMEGVVEINNKEIPMSLLSFNNKTYKKTLWFFSIDYGNMSFKDKDTTAKITLTGTDLLNHTASTEFMYGFDTRPPQYPTLVPLFDHAYDTLDDIVFDHDPYPVYYNQENGIHYTNSPTVFVTGTTNEYPLRVDFYLDDPVLTHATHDQRINAYPETANTPKTTIIQKAEKGDTELTIKDGAGSLITNTFVPGQYIMFSSHIRDQFGFYDVYYKIKGGSMINDGSSTLILEEPVERSISVGDVIGVYDQPYPFNWFGGTLNLDLGENTFWLSATDKGGNTVISETDEDIFTVWYDPISPKVVEHIPLAGTTGDDLTPIALIVKELKDGASYLNPDSLVITITGDLEKIVESNDQNLNITSYEQGPYIFYDIFYYPEKPLNGTYNVNFTAQDYAGNHLDDSNADAAWTFIVDLAAPKRPVLTIKDGTYYNGIWYINRSPEFTINFSDIEPVTLYEYLLIGSKDVDKEIICTEPSYNFFDCEFMTPLEPLVEEYDDIVILTNDLFDFWIVAHKTLDDGSLSPTGIYQDNKVVVDTLDPHINTVYFDDYIRDDFLHLFEFYVGHELHDLHATIYYGDESYELTQVEHNDTLYWFVWDVPNFQKDQSEKYWTEDFNDFKIVLSDYAGNAVEYDDQIYIDLTIPAIKNLIVEIPEAPLSEETPFGTNYTTGGLEYINVMGEFLWNDTEAIFLVPGTYDAPNGKFLNKTYGYLEPEDYPQNFTINLAIKGDYGQITHTTFTLVVIDKAGYEAEKLVYVSKDWKPPEVEESRFD